MSVRWIELEGAHNVRDLGGLRAEGGRTRDGVLLRSDALDQLTAADVERLIGDVGLAHVVDLRSATERIERGRGPLGATPVRYTEVEVIGPDDLARRAEARAAAFAAGAATGAGHRRRLRRAARPRRPRPSPPPSGAIAAPGGTPALVHCAIGKDRTGVLAALLLDAAGVDRDEIVADYARTSERMAPIIERWVVNNPSSGMSEQIAAFTATAAPETMDHVLTVLARALGWRRRLPRRQRPAGVGRRRLAQRSSSADTSVTAQVPGDLCGESARQEALTSSESGRMCRSGRGSSHSVIWARNRRSSATVSRPDHVRPGPGRLGGRSRRFRTVVGGTTERRRPCASSKWPTLLPATTGSVEVVIDALGAEYVAGGHEVMVIRPGRRHHLVHVGPHHVRVELPSVAVPASGGHRLFVRRAPVAGLIASWRPDVIEVHDTTTLTWAGPLAGRLGATGVLCAHERVSWRGPPAPPPASTSPSWPTASASRTRPSTPSA